MVILYPLTLNSIRLPLLQRNIDLKAHRSFLRKSEQPFQNAYQTSHITNDQSQQTSYLIKDLSFLKTHGNVVFLPTIQYSIVQFKDPQHSFKKEKEEENVKRVD